MDIRRCELCGERDAKYVCQGCGKLVCELCITPGTLLCEGCFERYGLRSLVPTESKNFAFIKDPMFLFFISFIIITVGMFLVMLSLMLSGAAEVGGAIMMIGPIPIFISSGVNPLLVILLGLILTIISVVIFFFWRKI